MEIHDLVAGFGLLIGLAGILLVVVPGMTIIVFSVFLWALVEATTIGWVAFVITAILAVGATFLKYTRPGRKLREAGVPTSRLLLALALAIIGFFVIPVVGAVLGFVLGIYLGETRQTGRERAWETTKVALGAIALSVGIELGAGFLIAAVWVIAVLAR